MSRIWVLGASGQVGRHITALLGEQAVGFDSTTLDFSSPNFAEHLAMQLQQSPPQLVINMAAYTDVAGAETNVQTAMQINGHAVKTLCDALSSMNIPLIHGSTDYVFSGHHDAPYREDYLPSPLNVYGKSKALGEKAVANYAQGYTLRFSWVYAADGKNFFTSMAALMQRHSQLRVVADQVGAPSYAGDIAKAVVAFAEKTLSATPPDSGMYHLCASGDTSWHGFACAIARALADAKQPIITKEIQAITAAEYGGNVQRPLNSRLSTHKLAALGIWLPHWREGLARCMQAMLAGK